MQVVALLVEGEQIEVSISCAQREKKALIRCKKERLIGAGTHTIIVTPQDAESELLVCCHWAAGDSRKSAVAEILVQV